jgi:type II secretory pathway component PulF
MRQNQKICYNGPMDSELKNRLDILEQKIDTISKDIQNIKKVFFWTFIITIAVIILPLIAMIFVIPQFISSVDTSSYSQLLGI